MKNICIICHQDDILGKELENALLACMAHARREFEKAVSNDKSRAEQANFSSFFII